MKLLDTLLTSCKAMLKEIVDETSVGKYDFMYLRIGEWPSSACTILLVTRRINRFCKQLQVCCVNPNTQYSREANKSSVGYAFINFEDVSISDSGLCICES